MVFSGKIMIPVLAFILVFLNLAGQGRAGNIDLPEPRKKGPVSLEETLVLRRTHRSFASKPLSREQLAQLLWAAYGVTLEKSGWNFKTVPSAGALYPLDIYVAAGTGGVDGLAAGVYHYLPEKHRLEPIKDGDLKKELAAACLGQNWMARAPVNLVITGEYERCAVKYGRRAKIYVPVEAGCAGQNIFLQAEALGLKAGIIGAFDNARVGRVLSLPKPHDPLLVMPVGYIK